MAVVVENDNGVSPLLDSGLYALRKGYLGSQSFTSGSTSLFLRSGRLACL